MTTPTVDSVTQVPIPLIQAVNLDIEGTATAPHEPPVTFEKEDAPIAMCFAGEGLLTGKSGFNRDERNYVLEVLVGPATQGIDRELWRFTRQMLDRYVATWAELRNNPLEYVLDYGQVSGYRVEINRTEGIRDSGVMSDMQVAPQLIYYGFTLGIPIVTMWGGNLL